ncbi:ATP-binding protein [Desulfobacterales bacterium HSG2]|nr:ATP-binding protein [Desulfobacterales bacterium HSG2]
MKTTFDIQNPWRIPGYTFSQEICIRRDIFEDMLRDLDKKPVTIVIGSRQVGKTFLMKKLIKRLISGKGVDPRQVFYFNFDALNLIDLIENDRDFLDFITHYGVPGKKSYVFLDEAQRIPEAGLIIKRYYDLDLNMKFVVSGSSSLEIRSQVRETLAGRKRLFELYPVSFREFLSFRKPDAHDDLSVIMKFESDRYESLMQEFLLFGGYPGVVTTDGTEDKIRLLREIYNAYMQKDISDFLKIEDVPGFNRLVHFAASQTGGLCKISEISKNIRISRHFVEKYLFTLEQTYIISFLRPYFVNLGKAIIKTPKLYFCDTGIRNSVFSQFEPLKNRADAGILVENFVYSELIKYVDKDHLWFYRTTGGSEVDFLFVRGNRVVPIECKYSSGRQKIVPRILTSLSKSAELEKAVVITRDYLHEKQRENLRVLFRPAWSVCRLLDIL